MFKAFQEGFLNECSNTNIIYFLYISFHNKQIIHIEEYACI